MAFAVFNGYLSFSKSIGSSGVSFVLNEPTYNKLQKERVSHRMVAWGKIADAIRPHLNRGTRFEITAEISYSKTGDKHYTNFTVRSWKTIAKPIKKPREEQPEPDDDYYVPEINNRCTREDRRYEGHTR